MLRLRLTGARIRWSSHMAAWVVWKQRMPPTSMTGRRQSSTRDLITRNSVSELGRQLRSSLPSSYTMISFQFRFFSISLPSLVVARSARLALPCCSRLRLNLSQQLTLMAPLMWLTLYAMKGRQSSSRKFLPPRPGEAGEAGEAGLHCSFLARLVSVMVAVCWMTRLRCSVLPSASSGLGGRLTVDAGREAGRGEERGEGEGHVGPRVPRLRDGPRELDVEGEPLTEHGGLARGHAGALLSVVAARVGWGPAVAVA